MRPLYDNLTENIIQVRIPLPFPLRWVNAYIVKESDAKVTVIDPGIHTEDAKQAWYQVLEETEINIDQIDTILLTHHHPDHFGLCGWLQEQSGAVVYMTTPAFHQATQLWMGDTPTTDRILHSFQEHGMEEEYIVAMQKHLRDFASYVTPFPTQVEFIQPTDTIKLAGRTWSLIHAPGHAFGQVMIYEQERRMLFCGDHVLPQISPNISYIPGVDDDPLDSYMRSLTELRKLEVDVAFPGHREPFRTFRERIDQLLQHHEERLEQMTAWLAEPMTTFALCRKMFGDSLSIHQLRFAMAETIAHVVYLEKKQLVTKKDGTIFYSSLL